MATYGSVPAPAEDSSPTVYEPVPADSQPAERDEVKQQTWRDGLRSFYERNFGLFLVFLAQSFGSVVCDPLRLTRCVSFHENRRVSLWQRKDQAEMLTPRNNNRCRQPQSS